CGGSMASRGSSASSLAARTLGGDCEPTVLAILRDGSPSRFCPHHIVAPSWRRRSSGASAERAPLAGLRVAQRYNVLGKPSSTASVMGLRAAEPVWPPSN